MFPGTPGCNGQGALGGGGDGGLGAGQPGKAGIVNSGGGGGGAGDGSGCTTVLPGGLGGSGMVMVKEAAVSGATAPGVWPQKAQYVNKVAGNWS